MKWNLTNLFESEEAFLKTLDECKDLIATIPSYEDKMEDEPYFVELLKLMIEIEIKLSKVYQYASLKSDLNKKDVINEANLKRCRLTVETLNQLSSYIYPTILAMGEDTVMRYIDNNPEIREYKFEIQKLFRNNLHILDGKSEKIISLYTPLTSTGSNLYSSLAVGDSQPSYVKLSNKEKVQVTQGNWQALIASQTNPKDRKKIFEAIFNPFQTFKNTYANIYSTVLAADKAEALVRNFSTSLEAHLFNNNIPVSVYHNLIKAASTTTNVVKKYLNLRKKQLHLSTYHTYDRFLDLCTSNKTYTYEQAKELFFKSIAFLPQDFIDNAHLALEDGYVDVYEQTGKRTGAYSSSVMNERPFILLNFDATLDSVFTLAHEAGHSIHSLYASTQPAKLQDYTIFVAEIASTFNEHVLLDYLLSLPTISNDEKIIMIEKAIDNIVSTFYRQTLFAEYELKAHQLVEDNEPVNHEVLSSIMIKLYKKYYGLDIEKEKVKKYVWAYIPHLFYSPYYVYQYATSFAASFKLYQNIKQNKEEGINKYLNLLKAGGSKYPTDEAKEAGVDFMNEETFEAVSNRMEELVNQLTTLLQK